MKNAILFYNGPMQPQTQPFEQTDMVAVLIVNGRLTSHIDLGSGATTLQLNNSQAPTVSDGKWHRVDLFLQRGARVYLDFCYFSL